MTAASSKVTGTGTAFRRAEGGAVPGVCVGHDAPRHADPVDHGRQNADPEGQLRAGTQAGTTTIVSADPTAFNLTIEPSGRDDRDLRGRVAEHGAAELCVGGGERSGQRLATGECVAGGSATPANPPAMSGIVGSTLAVGKAIAAIAGKAATGTAKLTQGSAAVTGTGTKFTTELKSGASGSVRR